MCFRTIKHIIKNDHLWVPCFCFSLSPLLMLVGITLALVFQKKGIWDSAIYVGAIFTFLCLGIICQGWKKNVFVNTKNKLRIVPRKIYPTVIVTVKQEVSSNKYTLPKK